MGAHPNRLTIPDARGHGASLRVTRHPAQRKIVLSHWRDGVCVASTPIELGEVSALIGVLADALGEAVHDTAGPAGAVGSVGSVGPVALGEAVAGEGGGRRSWRSIIRNLFQSQLGQITELRLVRNLPRDDAEPR